MQTTITPEIKEKAVGLYQAASSRYSEYPIAVLHIASDYTLLALGTKVEEPDAIGQFNIGTEKTATEFFRHNPPTPGEVENAIMTVEDEVMQVSKLIPAGTHLVTSDAAVAEIYAQLDAYQHRSGHVLLRNDMEAIFGRLSAIISGRPASTDTLPQTKSFAATLLILREVMFNVGFEEIKFFSIN